MRMRTISAVLLSALLTHSAFGQAGAKDVAKDKEGPKAPEKLGEKSLHEWLKIAEVDKDASERERAIKYIGNFPVAEVRKEATRLIHRLDSEPDTGVRLAVIDLVGALGIEKTEDVKEATRLLAAMANEKAGPLRLHSLQALGKFGPKAHDKVPLIISEVVTKDPAYEIRTAVSHCLGQIAKSETGGPDYRALKALAGGSAPAGTTGSMSRDPSLPVRLQSLQSLFILGPAWDLVKAGAKTNPTPADYDEKAAQDIVNLLKPRITGAKGLPLAESNVQAEMWCRLAIIRFDLKEAEREEQIKGIVAHLSDSDAAAKVNALETLSYLGEFALPKMELVTKLLNDSELMVRAQALQTLGAMGEKAFDPIANVIKDAKQDPDIRIAALAALARMGEKGENGRALVLEIIKDPKQLEDSTGVAVLTQALLTLGAMGIKAQSAVPELQDLMTRLDKVRSDRLSSPEYKKFKDSAEVKRLLDRLKPEEREKALSENTREDQYKKLVAETIRFINESTAGHPGGERKKP